MKFYKETANKRGIIYSVEIGEKNKKILFLVHAINRIKRWNISEEKVIETLCVPDEVLTGHRGRYIAHKIYGRHVMRVIYEYEDNLPVVITVYFPYAERYFQGGGRYEDKIF